MICSSCKNNVSDGVKFCPKCGKKVEVPAPSNEPAPKQKEPVKQLSNKKSKKDKSKTPNKRSREGLLILGALLLLLIGCVGGGYIGYRAYQKTGIVESLDEDWGTGVLRDKREEEQLESSAEFSSEETTSSDNLPSEVSDEEETVSTTIEEDAMAGVINGDEETVNPEVQNEFIIQDSNSRYLNQSDIANFTSEQLRIARNEIYARHGRKFKDEGLQAYFDAQTWYIGTIEADRFNETTLFNDVEKKNLELIKAREAVLN